MTLPYTQTNGLINGVSLSNTNNLRLMIVSSMSANPPVSSRGLDTATFNYYWNTNLPPGSDLLIQRVNLLPLFHRLIFNAEDTNNFGSFVVQSGTASSTNYVLTNAPADAWYLQGTVIGLYDTNNGLPNLESTIVVQADASYVFENTAWRGQLSGWGTNGPASPTATPPSAGDAFSTLATWFSATGNKYPPNPAPVILASFYAFMMDYNAWSSNNVFGSNYIWNALSQDAVRFQYLPSW